MKNKLIYFEEKKIENIKLIEGGLFGRSSSGGGSMCLQYGEGNNTPTEFTWEKDIVYRDGSVKYKGVSYNYD